MPPTPLSVLTQARELARAEGLHFVYIGNAPGLEEAGTTTCPQCHRILIQRQIYTVQQMEVVDGKCRFCGAPIAGLWKL